MEYNKILPENIIIDCIVHDSNILTKCIRILRPEYFDPKNAAILTFVANYYYHQKKSPPASLVRQYFPDYSPVLEEKSVYENSDYLVKEIERFCRFSALRKVLIESVDKLKDERYEEIENDIKTAISIKIDNDIGIDYKETIEERIKNYFKRESENVISTGYPELDRFVGGGFGKGELNIFAGQPGRGKSLFLQNITINWMLMQLDVVYYTLELSEEIVSKRLDVMISRLPLLYIKKEPEKAIEKIKSLLSNAGNLTVKYLPSGITINDIRAHLREYERKKGKKPDAIVVDYMDLMSPTNKRVSLSDLFVKDKYVSEELRSLATDENLYFITASQLNRESVDAEDFDLNHIAGGISKINTADNVIALKRFERKDEYELKFIKTRNSDGTGKSIRLTYIPLCLRIEDPSGSFNYQKYIEERKKLLDKNEEKQPSFDIDSVVSQEEKNDEEIPRIIDNKYESNFENIDHKEENDDGGVLLDIDDKEEDLEDFVKKLKNEGEKTKNGNLKNKKSDDMTYAVYEIEEVKELKRTSEKKMKNEIEKMESPSLEIFLEKEGIIHIMNKNFEKNKPDNVPLLEEKIDLWRKG